MFYVYSPLGRVFSGTLDQLRQTPSISAITRVRQAAPVARGLDERLLHQPSSHSTGGTVGAQQAMEAYRKPTRQPLTCVADVMRSPAHLVASTASVHEAWQELARLRIRQAPVADAQGVLVGLICRADLLPPEWLAGPTPDIRSWQALLAQPVTQLMSSPVPSTAADTDLRSVATLLLDTGLPGVPVTDDTGGVLGFVSRTDLLRALAHDPPLDLWG